MMVKMDGPSSVQSVNQLGPRALSLSAVMQHRMCIVPAQTQNLRRLESLIIGEYSESGGALRCRDLAVAVRDMESRPG